MRTTVSMSAAILTFGVVMGGVVAMPANAQNSPSSGVTTGSEQNQHQNSTGTGRESQSLPSGGASTGSTMGSGSRSPAMGPATGPGMDRDGARSGASSRGGASDMPGAGTGTAGGGR